ncbi:hypothetical protein ACQF4J_47100 (plasmid) [Streptomyces sp. C1-1]|uniref:hypothetical protein n=1 Tax=Streptomyces sp. C1-1 TaxID=3231173 RepID=UPI003D06246E
MPRAAACSTMLSNRAVAIRFGIGDRRLDEVRKRIGLPSYMRGWRSAFSSWEQAFDKQSRRGRAALPTRVPQ